MFKEQMILWWCFLLKLAKNISALRNDVKLVNPRITAEGYKIGTRGLQIPLHADDMIKNKEREEK